MMAGRDGGPGDIARQNAERKFRDSSEILKGFGVMDGRTRNRPDMVKLYDAKSRERDAAAKRAGL